MRHHFSESERLKQHPGVFDIEPPTFGSSTDAIEQWEMHSHYVNELVSRNLLKDAEGMAKSAGARRVAITRLGKMLLEAIGRPVDPET
jgi:hypothetical protein